MGRSSQLHGRVFKHYVIICLNTYLPVEMVNPGIGAPSVRTFLCYWRTRRLRVLRVGWTNSDQLFGNRKLKSCWSQSWSTPNLLNWEFVDPTSWKRSVLWDVLSCLSSGQHPWFDLCLMSYQAEDDDGQPKTCYQVCHTRVIKPSSTWSNPNQNHPQEKLWFHSLFWSFYIYLLCKYK